MGVVGVGGVGVVGVGGGIIVGDSGGGGGGGGGGDVSSVVGVDSRVGDGSAGVYDFGVGDVGDGNVVLLVWFWCYDCCCYCCVYVSVPTSV